MTEAMLSVQLIVRNEETLLPICMESIKSIADEIIVVDTGSTDRTIEIAQSYGATVYLSEWNDDFSQARNLALSYTNAQWIFYIDADEVLSQGQTNLRDLLNDADAEAYWVNVDNVLGRLPEERLQHRMVRLFRNRPSYRFRQRIHEQMIPAILESCEPNRIKPSAISLTHLGYFAEIKDQTEKNRRNERILNAMLAEEPADPFMLYNLGISKEQRGGAQEALHDLLSAKQLAPAAAAYRPGLIRDIAKVYLTLERPDEAARMLTEECANYPDYPDLLFLLGCSYRQQGLFPEAMQSFQKAAACPPLTAPYAIESGTATFRAYSEIGEILGKLKKWELAKTIFEKALESHAGYKPAILGWAAASDALNVSAESLASDLSQLLFYLPDRTEKFAEAMLYLGHYRQVLDAFANVSPNASRDLQHQAAIACLQLGQFDKALDLLQKLYATAPSTHWSGTAQIFALACWSRGAALDDEFYRALEDEEQRRYRALERRLWQSGPPREPEDGQLREIAEEMVEKAVQFGLLDLAYKLTRSASCSLSHLAECLYRSGFVRLAADLFLYHLEKNELNSSSAVFLAEILYDRRHFGEAASLFEQSVPEGADSSRIGAALSYLQSARQVLLEALEANPGAALLRGDLQKCEASIEQLEKLDWRTEWTPAQRRNAGVIPPDFLMHDREG